MGLLPQPAHIPTAPPPQAKSAGFSTLVGALGLAGLTTWAFWPTFNTLVGVWSENAQYSHGFLVPAFAGYVLWLRRDRFPAKLTPAPIWGGVLLVASLALHIVGGWRFAEWPEAISLLPFLLALAVCFGGKPLGKWSFPAIGFLAFMVPLPYRVEVALGAPLQNLATTISTFILQTLGQPAIADGNTILLREVRLGIVEACSGLKMLVTFVTFSTAICLVVQKPIADKLVILASSIPIALAVNVIRIVVTGLMHLHVSGETAKVFYHDLAGWVMMPMALAFLGVELWLLKRLILETPMRVATR